MERNGKHVQRLRLRTGRANWPAVAHAAVDNLLPTSHQQELRACYACADR